MKPVSPSSDSSEESSSEEEEEPPKALEKTPVKPSKKRKADALTSESISEVKESAPSSQAEQSKSARKKKKANKKKAQRKTKGSKEELTGGRTDFCDHAALSQKMSIAGLQKGAKGQPAL